MFEQLTLQPSYYTSQSDVAADFYDPVLSYSVSYDRVSGYFSSKALSSYAKGLLGLIHNNGKMRLIISIDISEDDFNLIKNGYKMRQQLEEGLLKKLDDILSEKEMVNYCNLAYLIAREYIDIKIGFTKRGIFHSKFGLCTDAVGNIIYFTGSNNETEAAIRNNFESFDITASWLSSSFDNQKIYKARKIFDNLWENTNKEEFIYVKDIDDIVKNKIVKYDRGKLIVDTEQLKQDAIILTIKENQLLLFDNLENYKISPHGFFVTQKLAPYLNPEYPYFFDSLTYIEINKIIKEFERESQKKGFNFIVSESLKKFLKKNAYWIEERSKYGILIKSQDEKVLKKFVDFKSIVSKELSRQLREIQMWSAFYMHEMKHAANFSVPGAGKTSMIYGVFAYLNSPEIDKVDKIVMIGPKNSFLSWKLEFKENFNGLKKMKVLDIHETFINEFMFQMDSGEKNLILVNYESLQRYESVLSNIIDNRTMLVFDEVHKIKGITSKRAQVAKRISVNGGYKFVLTGTPIPNTYQDIYNFLNILYAEEYKMFFNFKTSELINPGQIEAKEINDKLYPFFWRTTKDELGVTKANPDKIIKIVASSNEQNIINLLYRKYGHSPFLLYIRLIQVASNPELLLKSINYAEMYGEDVNPDWMTDTDNITFSESEVSIIRKVSETRKYIKAIELAESLFIQKKQVIIWCMFVNTIEKVQIDLNKRGIKSAVIYGNTPQNERDNLIERFKNCEIDILVTNPHTLAESVSLHKTCHDAIYLEYSFNLTHMLQSRDRIHRLGLKPGQYTQYYYLMLEGEIEGRNVIDEKIYFRLKDKEERMIEAIERGVLEPDPHEDYNEIISLFNEGV